MLEGVERSIDWDGAAIVIVDQCVLPGRYRTVRLGTVNELIAAIRRLAVRGAPALGAAGALGVVLSARHHRGDSDAVRADAERITAARPTAVNLGGGVARALARLGEGSAGVLAEALAMLGEDERINHAASRQAAELVLQRCARRPLRLLTHCNTGQLATVGWGTALGTVWHLQADGHLEEVLATESRPLLQGSRLTAWELSQRGVAYRVLPDAAAPAALAAGMVEGVLVGADRIAANGDVANKIGTYGLALAAARHEVPFIVVAPAATVDASLPDGRAITVEQRPAEEVTHVAGQPVAPARAEAFNPAFDITPAELVTAIVTEHGIQGSPHRDQGG